MTDVGTAALQIIPSFKGFQGKLEQGTDGSLSAAGTSGGRKYGDSAGRSMATAFTGHARKAGLVAGAGLALAGAAVIKLGRDSLAEAREAQKVGALTTQVIKSTGGAAKISAKQVGDLAGAISLKSGIDDEAIQSGANLLLTFKNVRNEAGKGNDIFSQTTQTMTDMSAALGTDASGSAIQLGKALNDPVKGITALSRVGVTFTEGQKEQIKALVASGDQLKAQKIILGELKTEFGGAAEASATMGEKVSVAVGNIKERIGTALLPVVDDLERAFLNKGIPAIESALEVFEKKGIPALRDFGKFAGEVVVPALGDIAREVGPLAKSALPALLDGFGLARDILQEVAPLAIKVFDKFNTLPDAAQKAILIGAGAVALGAKAGFGSGGGGLASSAVSGSTEGLAGKVFGSVFSRGKPLPVFVVNNGVGGTGIPGAHKGGGKIASGLKAAGAIAAGAAPVVAGAGVLAGAGTVGVMDLFNKYAPKSPLKGSPTGVSGGGAGFGSGVLDMSGMDKEWEEAKAKEKAALDSMTVTARAAMNEIAASFKTLPPDVQTDIVLHGAPESRRAVMELVRQYNLTPAQKRTLFETSGIPQNKKATIEYRSVIDGTPRHIATSFSLSGIESARAQIATLSANLHALESRGDHMLPYLSGGARAARAGGGGVDPSTTYLVGERGPELFRPRYPGEIVPNHDLSRGGTRGSNRPAVINIHLGGEKVATIIDDRINAHSDLNDQRGRASR